jgi:MoaA/NifB/PqqE/SkfB family radical SAM enzyme
VAINLTQEKIRKIEEDLIDDFEVGQQSTRPEVLIEQMKLQHLLQLVEPCESGLFSSYVNSNGVYHPCSFEEGRNDDIWRGFDVLGPDRFEDFWQHHPRMKLWRESLAASWRSCPIYEV